MKIPPRNKMPEQDPVSRRKNFQEVTLGFTPDLARAEAKRCQECFNPTCIAGCPVEIDIPGFIAKIKTGDFLEAIKNLKTKNSLPAICGRVCPQESQCEKECLLAKKFEPVAIGRLERFAADYELTNPLPSPRRPKSLGQKVAAVGSGPAGLTLAGDLAKIGYPVTIFEALHKPGGVLVYGIPEFRLPKAVIFKEINYIQSLGVKIETDVVVGRTVTIDELLAEGYQAVFIGVGAGSPMFMKIAGENLNGVYSANEFLTRVNLMKAYEFPRYDTPVKAGKKVVVVGGGNVAMDGARSALRLGAQEVSIIYRRSEKEMPARAEEVEHAKAEGINFNFLANPVEILGNDQGWVSGIKVIKMELGEPDASGRRRPIPLAGSEYNLEVDMVIMALGTNANPVIAQTTPGLKTNQWGYLEVDPKTMATSREGIYAGGDIVTGSATVIWAMGAGRIAAKAIDLYLQKKRDHK